MENETSNFGAFLGENSALGDNLHSKGADLRNLANLL